MKENDNDDVKTVITDIKTIYDNNTLMNVPMYGTMNSLHDLPPLPNIKDLDMNNDHKIPNYQRKC